MCAVKEGRCGKEWGINIFYGEARAGSVLGSAGQEGHVQSVGRLEESISYVYGIQINIQSTFSTFED
jgi:hypothetical protein